MPVRWIVQPNVVGGWDVRPEDSGSYVFRSSGRAAAEQEAHRLADRSGGSVVVLDGRGNVLDSYVPPSAPLPPLRAPRPREPEKSVATPSRPAAPPASPGPLPAREEPGSERAEDPLAVFARTLANGKGDLSDRVTEAVEQGLTGRADEALDRSFQSVFAAADQPRRWAIRGIWAAALVGPMGTFGISLFEKSMHPRLSSQIMESLFWLTVLTLPVLAAAGVAVLVAGRTNLWAGLLAMAVTAVAAAGVLTLLGAPSQLGSLYCYADWQSGHAVYEHACRVMNTQAFVNGNIGDLTPGRSASVLGNAFYMVAEARGALMAVAGIVAGISGGYLLRSWAA